MSPKGRHAKSKARINDYEEMVASKSEKRADDLEIYVPPGPRLGDVVIEAHKVSKSYGDTVLFEDVEFTLREVSSALSVRTERAKPRCFG